MTNPILQNWTGIPIYYMPSLDRNRGIRIPVTGAPLTPEHPERGIITAVTERGQEIPVHGPYNGDQAGLPTPVAGVLLIVTPQVAALAPHRTDLVTPAGHTEYGTRRILCTDLTKPR